MSAPSKYLLPRLVARGIDVGLLAAIDVGLGQLIGFGFDWLGIATALVLVYFAGLDAALGTTPGKRLLGLKVVGPDGTRPTLRQALVRECFTVLGAIPFAGPIVALGAWIWILVTIRSSPLGQGKHDTLAGGTRVVAVDAQVRRRTSSPATPIRSCRSRLGASGGPAGCVAGRRASGRAVQQIRVPKIAFPGSALGLPAAIGAARAFDRLHEVCVVPGLGGVRERCSLHVSFLLALQ